MAVVFVYESQPSSNSPTPPPISFDKLHTALTHLLNYYPHLTGRFRLDLIKGKHTIDRIGTGAALHEAIVDQPLSSFRSSAGVYSILDQLDAGNDLLGPYDSSIEALGEDPIFTIQYTQFACGGVAIGIRCPHIVTDADGFFRLARDLSTIYRSLDEGGDGKLAKERVPCVLPYLAGWKGDETEMETAKEYKPTLFSTFEPSHNDLPPPSNNPRPPVTGREFHFSTSDLALIRDLASTPSRSISPFVALSAWLYQQIHKARLILQETQPEIHKITTTDFLTPLNLRAANRLPGLPANYFPNAALAHYTSISPEDVGSLPLPALAERILNMIVRDSTTGDEAIRTCRWLAAQPNLNNVQFGMKHGQGAFMISQWNKFDMYGEEAVQFIQGEKPVLVSPPFTPISLVDGLAYVLPPHPKDGIEEEGVVVYLSLVEPLWDILEREGLLQVNRSDDVESRVG